MRKLKFKEISLVAGGDSCECTGNGERLIGKANRDSKLGNAKECKRWCCDNMKATYWKWVGIEIIITTEDILNLTNSSSHHEYSFYTNPTDAKKTEGFCDQGCKACSVM